ncbi:MAG: PAS domain S-box protein [Alphaproteobacteria bacterium]|nr:PAS domain S-box protein [Alphaproteobacteria bacterium]
MAERTDNRDTSRPGMGEDPLMVGCVAALVALLCATVAVFAWRGAPAVELVLAGGGVAAATLVGIAGMWVMRRRHAGLLKQQLLWRDVGDVLPFPACVVDGRGRALFSNDGFERMFPDSSHAPLARLGERIGASPETSERIARMTSAVGKGIPMTDEMSARSEADGIGWFRVSAFPLEQSPGCALWTVEDITSRRRMEQTIHDEQAKLVDFLENAPIGFYSVDQNGRFLFVNNAFAEWLGYTPEDLVASEMHLHDFLLNRPEHGTKPYRPLAASPGGGEEAGGYEVMLKGRDGVPFQVYIGQTEVAGRDGGLRTRSVVRDLTPEREWEQALRRSEQRFARFFEDAPVGIVLLDAEGRVTESNRAWRALVAPVDQKLLGRRITDFVMDEDDGKVTTWLERVMADADLAAPTDVRLRTATETGGPRIATMYVSRMDDGQGGIYGLIVHFLETTEQRSLEAQFAQGQKMQAVGQLAGGIAHDFNNLLTAMIGFCDLLLLRHSPGDQSFGDIMQIKQNANRAAGLVRQLLAFSRQQTLQPRVLSMTDVLGDLSNLLRRLIGANIRLNMIHGRDLPPVRADQGQVEQVIINLAVNARDAMAEGGELTIETSKETLVTTERRGVEPVPAGDYVVLKVSDTGVGIPKENLEHIFEPFFTTKEVGEGTGLGLSTVYGIVKQTGGYVLVDSNPGKGTSFTIMLPAHAQPVAAQSEAEKSEAPGAAETTGVGTVMIVEDEDAVRLFSARALRAKGYKVVEARTGEAAMELMGVVEDPIDLLITDAVMPEMDGPTLIKNVRDKTPELPVICISGYAEETFRNRLGEDTDIHFLPKPFSLAQLAGKVKEVMDRGGA